MWRRRIISVEEYDRQQRSLVWIGAGLFVALLLITFFAKDRYLLSIQPMAIVSPLLLLPGIALALRYSFDIGRSVRREQGRIVVSEPMILTVCHVVYIVGFWVVIGAIVHGALFRFTGLSGGMLVLANIGLSDTIPRTRGILKSPWKSYLALSEEGMEMRGSYGEVSRVPWSYFPRVSSVKRAMFLTIEPVQEGSGKAELWTLPIRYSAIERIVNYYVDHPEARAVLGTEEGVRQVERLSR